MSAALGKAETAALVAGRFAEPQDGPARPPGLESGAPNPNQTQGAVRPEPLREAEALAEALAHIAELGASARALWRAGHVAMSYALTCQQLSMIARTQISHTDARVARQAALSARVEEALQALDKLGRPELDAQCNAAHARGLQHALHTVEAWCRFAQEVSSPRRAAIRRALRIAVWALLGVGVASALTPPELRVVASSRYSTDYAAALVTDGIAVTEWLLPDHRSGWLELQFRTPRPIRAVRITNSINREHRDRATRAFHIELFHGAHKVAARSSEFATLDERTRRFEFDAAQVDRLRLVIDSHHGHGAGIAEIELEPRRPGSRPWAWLRAALTPR